MSDEDILEMLSNDPQTAKIAKAMNCENWSAKFDTDYNGEQIGFLIEFYRKESEE